MRRDIFEYLLSVVHFANNQEMNDDRYYKVRPIFDNLNKSKIFCDNVRDFSVDEIMIPYYGRHSSKQFIRGKPIRYGYKVWCIATSKGFGVTFEPYCGKDTRVQDANLGQGPNVVLDLVKKSDLREGCQVFFDNLFTSFPLLDELSRLGIAGTGTVRQNRLNRVPLPKKKTAAALERGEVKSVYQQDRICTLWKDSKPVYVASNKFGDVCGTQAKRYSRIDHKYVNIQRPDLITEYNDKMGGVDLLDSTVSCYRIKIRKKKWYFPFYSWSLSVAAVNAWRLRNQIRGEKEPYLEFLMELVRQMGEKYGVPAGATARRITVSTL